ncbi:hypothetical protein BT63DRAFT_329902 [Microthyrium microscopicum]|uniref:F-box domain-containing protein n=1 Tax=Microthyrium microscopicum TaxID=703497 RepID=A0A6A6U868_9PEZI|nr:hypothetical protein BT63DRAFT_329902 [Microthyrium microscopicum]
MMETIPPSYLQATNRDHWSIISSFVPSKDLCSAALVSKQWNRIFTPHLWGNPASHFGTENDVVYVALVRFKRTLVWARSSTRELTHTLRLPPAHAEMYDGPHAEWLRDILVRLPRLQSLIVSELPFFDHGALINIPLGKTNPAGDFHTATYPLRLLEASSCFNATSNGLASALKCFSSITYLDLSNTLPAKDTNVFAALQALSGLQILKLRRLGLKDEDIRVVAEAVGLRVRSLDVRENRLTNKAVRFILQHCVTTPSQAAEVIRRNVENSGGLSASMQMYFGVDLPPLYHTDYQDRFVYDRFTSGFFPHLGVEDACGTGLTHLYISGNQLSAPAVADMLRLKRFHVLDVGSFIPDSSPLSPGDRFNKVSRLAVAERLVPLFEINGGTIDYLKIDHAIITEYCDPTLAIAELDTGHDIETEVNQPFIAIDNQVSMIAELEGDTRDIQELPADSAMVFELEGSPAPPSPRINVSQQPTGSVEPSPQRPNLSPRSISQNAPEVITGCVVSPLLSPHSEHFGPIENITPMSSSPVHPASSSFLHPASAGSAQPTTPSSTHTASTGSLLPPQPTLKHKRTYSGVLMDHESRIAYQKSQPHGLLPSMIPCLRMLELTDVPSHWPSKEVSDRVIAFITACAEESHWSRLQAQHAYQLPPGQNRHTAERSYAQSLFGLKQLVLHMRSKSLPHRSSLISAPRSPGKSSVEDADCETFWKAASDDFSFFGSEAEEECGVPRLDANRSIPLEARQGKMVVGDDDAFAPMMTGAESINIESAVDVLAEVSKFRRDRKAKYEIALRRGEINPYIKGYWDGDIVVVKPER